MISLRDTIMYSIIIIMMSTFSGCNKSSEIVLGYTAPGIPITLAVSSTGLVKLSLGAKLATPAGTFALSIQNDYFINPNRTQIIILDRYQNKKHVFELLPGNHFKYEDFSRTKITIRQTKYESQIEIDSDKVSHFLKHAGGKSVKPFFPESPVPFFYFTKKINVDWSINNFGDVILIILYCIIYYLAFMLDIFVISILFLFRLLVFILKGLFYIIGSML